MTKVEEAEDSMKDSIYSPQSSSEESELDSEHEGERKSEAKGSKRQKKEAMERDQEPSKEIEPGRRYITYINPHDGSNQRSLNVPGLPDSRKLLSLRSKSLMTNSKISMKYMTHVAKTEFDIDLSKEHELRALEREKETFNGDDVSS